MIMEKIMILMIKLLFSKGFGREGSSIVKRDLEELHSVCKTPADSFLFVWEESEELLLAPHSSSFSFINARGCTGAGSSEYVNKLSRTRARLFLLHLGE